ncbi:MAG: DUF4367 domain-containing protein [Oscillospiraceae bacterium]|nr:DUF4367 domain-containing protein [Oscillospiraceae bacterium]MBR6657968.1 DUF4367 domain-containing protein [Oscillospiraceae bacterium]
MYNLSEKAIAEKYEDLLFTKVMALYAAEESEKILSEIENEEPADPKNIEKIYSKTERRENLSTIWKVSKKLITFAAMVVFVAVVSLSSVVVASAEAREAVAEAIYHLVLRKTDRYTEVSIGNSTGFIDPEIYDWEGAYGLTFVPDAYKFKEKKSAGTKNVIIYESNNGHFTFSQSNGNPIARVDTEDAENVETIIINESEALLVEKDGFVIITWNNQNTFFSLRGTLPADTLIFMAQGIKPLGKTETEEPAEEYEFIDEDVFYWNGAYAPTYIPEDFEITSKNYLNDTCAITYSKGGESFVIYQITGSATISVDTENADISKEIKINNSSGLYVVKDNNCSISWNEGKTLLWLTGEVDEKELLKVAEGMKFTGENKVPKEYPFFDPENYDWEGAFAPTFVPEGFVFSDMQKGENVKLATYTFEDSYFYFTQTKNLSYARIDTEDAEIDTKGFIGNSEALFVHEKGFSSVVWSVGDTYFSVEGMISLYDAVKIAQHIRPIN